MKTTEDKEKYYKRSNNTRRWKEARQNRQENESEEKWTEKEND